LLAAIAVGAAACGTATRSAGPGGQHVNDVPLVAWSWFV
jgi:hypothetical protein